MMNCKKASRLVSKKHDQKLTFWENISLSFHLMMCKYCRLFEKEIKIIEKTIETSSQTKMSATSKEKLKKQLGQNH